MALSSFAKGKLKIAAHVREELDRAGIGFEALSCKSGGTQIPRDMARLSITADGIAAHLDLQAGEIEECESIVAGEAWYKIAAFIDRLRPVNRR